MKKYDTYKDSGIDWVGEIPSHWRILKLRYLTEVVNGATPKSEIDKYWDGAIKWITPSDISQVEGKFILDSRRTITEEGLNSCGTSLVPEGAIILTTRAPIGNITIAGTELCTNQGCKALLFSNKKSDYFYYQLIAFKDQLEVLGNGSTFKELSTTSLKNLPTVLPSQEEQLIISNYLDKKTSEIDTLILQKKNLLDKLQLKRQAITNEAVTKGIDPNAKMKDSGIEWLGKIPQYWEVKNLKYLVEMKSGDLINAESINTEGTYPVYGGNGLRGFTSLSTHKGEYILIGRQGALCGNINYASGDFWASEHAVVVSHKIPINIYWLGELLRTMNLNQYSIASAQPGLSVERIKQLKVPYPSILEQNDIAIYISNRTEKIKLIEQKIRCQINKLKTYRQSLISEVATGKIKVA